MPTQLVSLRECHIRAFKFPLLFVEIVIYIIIIVIYFTIFNILLL